MVPGALALIARAYPAETRGRAIGIWASASAITTAAGPILGGALLSLGPPETWRAIFLVNLPLGAAALWLLGTRVAQDARGRAAARLDVPGAALATAGLACLAFALTEAEHGGPPGAGELALGAAGVALLAAFVRVERRAAAPMLPMDLFARPGFAAANAVTFALYFALSAILFFLPMTAIAGWGVSPLTAALAFAPLSVLIGAFSPRIGRLADRTGPRPWIAAGTATAGAGYAAMALAAPAQAFWAGLMPGALLMGLGMMLVVAPLSTAVMAAAGEDSAGAASGVNNAVSRVAGLIAVAAMGPVAAAAYAGAGGPASFGAPSDMAGHAAASAAAFSAVAGLAALSALAAAALAWAGLRRP
jgi:MFS family permease